MISVAAGLGAMSAQAQPAQLQPRSWDGLLNVESSRYGAVSVVPGANLRAYRRLMVEPVEVGFREDWLRNYNSALGAQDAPRLSGPEAARVMAAVRAGVGDHFAEAFRRAGYELVGAPGPGVLRVRIAVVNLDPSPAAGCAVPAYACDVTGAVLALEARDSLTDALLGRALDRRIAKNQGDLARLFGAWAGESIEAFAALRTQSAAYAGDPPYWESRQAD
jgi:hypothetical protein